MLGTWAVATLAHLSVPPGTRGRLWPLAYLGLAAMAGASLAYRAWKARQDERLAWGLLAASALLEVPNLLINFLQILGRLPQGASTACDLLTLGTGALVLAGVLSLPTGVSQGPILRRRLLDGLLFAVSVLFLLWMLDAHGTLRSGLRQLSARVMVDYMNLALLGGGLVFKASYPSNRFRPVLGWLGASTLMWVAAISCWTLMGLPPEPAFERWAPLAGGIPVFQGLAAWSSLETRTDGREELMGARLGRFLPYLPVAGAVAVLGFLLIWTPRAASREGIVIFLAMVSLLLLRQIQAIEDLEAARRSLEARVQSRTQALKRAQDTMLRAERMNTLAMIGAGLAHDLNNLICTVKQSAELAALKLENGAGGPEDLDRITMAADRAARLTTRLMGFARREEEHLCFLDLSTVIKGMEGTLRLLLPRSVDLCIEAAPGVGMTVQSSMLRVEQMVVNLVVNARDAMPDGGVLTVRTGVGMEDTPMALLEVTDTGIGMAPDTLARIFDPFFTTKPAGQGTGLGLSSLKAMVEEGDGRMEVASEPGRGARFRIYLPLMPSAGVSPR